MGDTGNLYHPHPLMIDSGTFWRCRHGTTGYGNNMRWEGCKPCALERIEELKLEAKWAWEPLDTPEGREK